MEHDRRAEDRFGRAERRQLWARDLRLPADAPLTYLEEGAASELRADCKAGHLICPVPECPLPRISTRAGSRRDHFFHVARTGVSHAPESWFHYTGKHLVGWWLHIRHPEASVRVDDLAVDNGQRPDVFATFPDGRRIAFEVQYAPITAEAWQQRHDGYATQGITDIWLFGHAGAHFRSARGEMSEGRVRLNPAHHAVEAVGLSLHWINPDERTIGTRRRASDSLWPGPWARDRGRYAVDQLLSCRLEGTEFVTPTARRDAKLLAEQQARELAEREAEEREDREAAARYERRRAIEEREETEYQEHLRPAIIEKLGGAIEAIEYPLRWDRGIWRHRYRWHAELFERFIEGKVGQSFEYRHAVGPFMDFGPRRGVFAAMSGYLRHLRDAGYLWFENDGTRIIDPIHVRADSTHPPRRITAPARYDWNQRAGFRSEREWEALLERTSGSA